MTAGGGNPRGGVGPMSACSVRNDSHDRADIGKRLVLSDVGGELA
jgi:hypothetical protein